MKLMRSLRLLPLLALSLTAVACSSDDEIIAPQGSIALLVDPPTLSVISGETGTVTTSVTRAGGFAGGVTFSVEGAPAGVTWAFQPETAIAGVSTTSLVITVATDATPGTYTLTVRGVGTEVIAATREVALTVVAPDPGT